MRKLLPLRAFPFLADQTVHRATTGPAAGTLPFHSEASPTFQSNSTSRPTASTRSTTPSAGDPSTR